MKKFIHILALVLGIGRIYGASLPDPTKQELITDFSGGLNTSDPSHKLETKYSPYMRNVFIDSGKIERINGYQTLGSSNVLSKVTGIFPFVRENGLTTFLVTDSSMTIETADFKSWTFVSSASSTGALLYWMQVRNKMWGYNGVDPVMTWDGTSKVILNGQLTGSQSTPNVPRFRYGAYYQDRVWGLGIPGGASDLYFSSIVSTDNIIMAPDNQFAWPAINAMFVGRGDGTVGTALWIYQGLLRAGKEQSIYTIYGDNPSNYLPRKEEANVGVASQESVRVLDGEVHFISQNGVYRNIRRISDLIVPDIEVMNTGLSSILSNSWDTQADFARGHFYGSTATASGFLTTSKEQDSGSAEKVQALKFSTETFAGDGPAGLTLSAGTTFFGWRRQTPALTYATTNINNSAREFTKRVGLTFARAGNTSVEPIARVTIRNIFTGIEAAAGLVTISNIGIPASQVFQFPTQHPIFSGYEINSASLTLKIELANFATPSVDDLLISNTGSDAWFFVQATTVQYLSEVSTLSMVTAWGPFNTTVNTAGGSIATYFRTSTSAVNISTQVWAPINSGALIVAPLINNYIQWATTITSISSASVSGTNIDIVSIDHIEGQASDARPFAMDWNNRYWLTVTTTSDPTKRLTYVKSLNTNQNPDAWMPVDAYPIDCYAKLGNILYGGSASTSAVYRLDFGSNLDGQPINSTYDTPDLTLNDFFQDKYILKYLFDGEKSGNGVMTIGTSRNQGDFTSSTFTIAGSGRYSRIVEGVTGYAKTIRLRLQNGEKDIGLGINNVNILYTSEKSLSNK